MAETKSFLLGLTGGIGSGKSTVCALFKAKGIPILSADDLAREVVTPGSPALEEIRQEFGEAVFKSDGCLDRGALRSVISADANARKVLEAIMHPRIQELSSSKTAALTKQGAKLIVYEAPLLFEAASDRRLDAVATVIADDELRIKRILVRDGGSEVEARRLLQSQMTQEEKAKRSRWVIVNNGHESDLQEQVDAILVELGFA